MNIQSPPLGVIDTALALQAPNPFDLPPDSELFAMRDREAQLQKEHQKKVMKQSLVERTLSCLPPLHSQSRHACRSVSESTAGFQIAPPVAEHQRRQQMAEFVDQKREIFLVQLLIDRKNKEIQRIQQLRKTEKKNIREEEAKIAETTNQYKMTTNQMEAELTRAKKAMDAAIKHRTELSKELKKKKAYVAVVKSEISRNDETLEAYRTYSEFLKRLTPPDSTVQEYFNDPQVLLDELEKVENENLFLIQHCQELYYEQETGITSLTTQIDQVDYEACELKKGIEKLNDGLKVSTEFDTSTSSVANKESDQLELQLKRLSKYVSETYRNCFKETADVNTLTRLERIENELERMYRGSECIDPAFIAAKQTEKDKVRRDIQRKAKAEKQALEQQRKLDQALARAKMPIKRKTGRPCNERILPIKSKRPQDEKKKQMEVKAQEDFLFGDTIYT